MKHRRAFDGIFITSKVFYYLVYGRIRGQKRGAAMSRLTHHAKRRMEERGNITHDRDAEKNAERAMKKGIRHFETTGEVHKWMDGKFLHKRSASHMRIYRGYLYLFHYGTLITLLELPERIVDALPNCVSDDVYRRYISYQQDRDQWKSAVKAAKKSEEERAVTKAKRRAFWSRVLIMDVEVSLPDLPAKIYGIHFDKNGITVFFIPDHNERPNLSVLAEYLKDYYGYRYVYLKHMRDENGELMFGTYDDPYEPEVVYSSEGAEKEGSSSGTLGDLLKEIVLPE